MPKHSAHIYPVFDRVLARREKEVKLRQRARVVWLYGLPGSGKTTLAAALERRLHAEGFTTHLLDGDNLRAGLNRDLGFSEAGRTENIRRAAEVSKLFMQAGIVVICAFITPTRALRKLARGIIGADDFLEVYVEAARETCARRDPKGLYAGAGRGEITRFTGHDAAFEPPEHADLVVNTDHESVEQSLARIHRLTIPRLRLAPS
ncbi:MAG TPA: adenylyl-sulfate kinase [Opitutaceae bacterium]|nr:adenylyl-sulfate kinase [Opitutaceae bacterium]